MVWFSDVCQGQTFLYLNIDKGLSFLGVSAKEKLSQTQFSNSHAAFKKIISSFCRNLRFAESCDIPMALYGKVSQSNKSIFNVCKKWRPNSIGISFFITFFIRVRLTCCEKKRRNTKCSYQMHSKPSFALIHL